MNAQIPVYLQTLHQINSQMMNWQSSPGFLGLDIYEENTGDPEQVTFLQLEWWEDEESLINDIASAHTQNFFKVMGEKFDFAMKSYTK